MLLTRIALVANLAQFVVDVQIKLEGLKLLLFELLVLN